MEEAKQQIINRLSNVLKGQAMYVREDDTLSNTERLQQMDVLLDLMKFIRNYDENAKILNQYLQKQNQKGDDIER